MTSIRVVLVDDQELVRTGFRLILESEPGIEVVGEAADGAAALRLLRRTPCDVVLMDVRMPELDGIEATRTLVEERDADQPRVIILTTFDADEYVLAALRHGASGFLLKDTPADDLIGAIRVVADGEALLGPSATRRLIERFRRDGLADPEAYPGLADLTEREREVLVELAQGKSNSEIGSSLHVSEATVKTHVGRLLTKLAVRDRVQAVIIAYESGIVTPGRGAT